MTIAILRAANSVVHAVARDGLGPGNSDKNRWLEEDIIIFTQIGSG